MSGGRVSKKGEDGVLDLVNVVQVQGGTNTGQELVMGVLLCNSVSNLDLFINLFEVRHTRNLAPELGGVANNMAVLPEQPHGIGAGGSHTHHGQQNSTRFNLHIVGFSKLTIVRKVEIVKYKEALPKDRNAEAQKNVRM